MASQTASHAVMRTPMSGATSWLPLLVCLAGCQSDCESVACPNLETSAHPQAITVPLAPGTTARLRLEDESGIVLLSGGDLRFSVSPPACLVSAGSDCQITLERLQLELSRFTIETNLGTVTMDNVTLRLQEPVQLANEAAGYVLPADSQVHTCGSVDGRDDHGVSSLRESSLLRLDAVSETLTLEGQFPVVFHAGDGTCHRLEGSLALTAAGGPWSSSLQHTDGGTSEVDAAARR